MTEVSQDIRDLILGRLFPLTQMLEAESRTSLRRKLVEFGNELHQLRLQTQRQEIDPLSITELRHVCQKCQRTFPKDDGRLTTTGIRNLCERVMPGDPMPSGECPLCHGLTHLEMVERPPTSVEPGQMAYILVCQNYRYDDEFYHATKGLSPGAGVYLTRDAAERACKALNRTWIQEWHELPFPEGGPDFRKSEDELVKKMRDLYNIELDFDELVDNPFKSSGIPDGAIDLFFEYVALDGWAIHEVQVQ